MSALVVQLVEHSLVLKADSYGFKSKVAKSSLQTGITWQIFIVCLGGGAVFILAFP